MLNMAEYSSKNKKVTALVVTFLFFIAANFFVWLGIEDLNDFTASDTYEIRKLYDYSAIYVDESTLFLIEKKPYHGTLRLGEEEVNNINLFTETCFLCTRSGCPYNTTQVTIPISRQGGITLSIYDFAVCRIPEKCVWFGRFFNCMDLIAINKLTRLYKKIDK